MSRNKIILYSTGVVVIFLAIWFGYGAHRWANNPKVTNSLTQPLAFYVQGQIARFDPAGNAIGTPTLYRLNGLAGSREKVRTMLAETYIGQSSGAVLKGQSLEITYAQNFTPGTSPEKLTREDVDLNGRVLKTTIIEMAGTNPLRQTKITPDGKYTATSSIVCHTSPADGPCADDVALIITQLGQDKKITLNGRALGLSQTKSKNILLYDFTPDNKVILSVQEQQEAGIQILNAVDLGSGTVHEIIRNNGVAGTPDKVWAYLQTSRNGQDLFLSARSSSGVELVKMNTSSYVMTPLYQITGFHDLFVNPAETGVAIAGEYNQGSQYYDFTTQKTSTLHATGAFLTWSHDGKHFAWLVYDTNNGLGPKKVYVQERASQRKTLLFQQRGPVMNSFGLNTNQTTDAIIGDMVYEFVGLY